MVCNQLVYIISSSSSQWVNIKDANTVAAFTTDDAVESISYDALNVRLAVSSHSGHIRVFRVQDGSECIPIPGKRRTTYEHHTATLSPAWKLKLDYGIPRGLRFFGSSGESLLAHCLESGET